MQLLLVLVPLQELVLVPFPVLVEEQELPVPVQELVLAAAAAGGGDDSTT